MKRFSWLFSLLKQTYHEWSEDKAPRLGAALAYYSLFSIGPLLLIAISIAAMVFDPGQAREQILKQVGDTIGPRTAQAVAGMVDSSRASGASWIATTVGIITLLFGAAGVFGQLQDALNTIWKVAPKPGRGIWGFIRDRFLSLSLVFGTGFLLLVSLVASTALQALGDWLTPASMPGGAMLWEGINFAISFAFITLLFMMIYKVLPDAKIAWGDVWHGALVTALLFTVGKYLIGLYLGRGSVASAYGAAGSLVVILLWVYYSSQILLFGAEFTRVYADRYGSRVVPTPNAVPLTKEMRARQGIPTDQDLHAANGHDGSTQRQPAGEGQS